MSEDVDDVNGVEDDGEVPFEEEPEGEEEEETCSWCGENPCVCAETAEAA